MPKLVNKKPAVQQRYGFDTSSATKSVDFWKSLISEPFMSKTIKTIGMQRSAKDRLDLMVMGHILDFV
jgi:hypothetical protein